VFVVPGASGNTGKAVAETLLSQNKKVRVVVRDIAKGQAWKDAGADVSIADVRGRCCARACIQRRGGCLRSSPSEFQLQGLARGHAVVIRESLSGALDAVGYWQRGHYGFRDEEAGWRPFGRR
jgi:nucleoside-diphosphate-sugar epimerase